MNPSIKFMGLVQYEGGWPKSNGRADILKSGLKLIDDNKMSGNLKDSSNF